MPDAPTASSAPARRTLGWAGAAVVFGLAFLAYGPALGGELLWDDPSHVTRPELRSLEGFGRIWFDVHATQQYYPVLHSAFWLESQLWGDATLGYHLINVVWHALACCLFALLLQRLGRSAAAEGSTGIIIPAPAAWLAAVILAVHPVAVESVAWISEQKNTLSLLFYLLAALAYLDFDDKRRRRDYVRATVWFGLALGSKTVTATLPAAWLVITWWRRGRIEWRRDVMPLLPWFGLAMIAGLSTAWIEVNLIGAEGAEFSLSLLDRVLLAGRVLWFYAGHSLWPVNLAFFYERWDVPMAAGGWWLYLVAALAMTAGLWALRHRTRGPLAAWLLFGGSLFPALGFFNVFPFTFSYVADHFQYLALFWLVGAVVVAAVRCWPSQSTVARASGGLVVAAVVVAAIPLAREQSGFYQSWESLFGANVARVPSNWMAHRGLAHAYADQPGRDAEAIAHYRESLRLNPDPAETYHGLAMVLSRDPAQRPEAIALLEEAIERRDNFAEAHSELAFLLGDQPARQVEAEQHLRTALQIDPEVASAHAYLADLLARQPDRLAEAVHHYEIALEIEPDKAGVHFNFANALARIPGRMPAAVAQYEAALALEPDSAEIHGNLAAALMQMPGREAEGLAHYQTALDLDPNLPWLHQNIALMFAALPGRGAEALRHGREAVRLAPRNPATHHTLALVHAQLGDLNNAQREWEAALALDPNFEIARENLRRLTQIRAGRL